MDSLMPPSKISNLTQGMSVDSVADNFDKRIEHKTLHCEIVVDNAKPAGKRTCGFVLTRPDYNRIKEETKQIVTAELQSIKGNSARRISYSNRSKL